jgi:hypothetical protein
VGSRMPASMAGVQSQHWAQDKEGARRSFPASSHGLSLQATSEAQPRSIEYKRVSTIISSISQVRNQATTDLHSFITATACEGSYRS